MISYISTCSCHANELAPEVKLLAHYLSELAMVLQALRGEMDGKCALETIQDQHVGEK